MNTIVIEAKQCPNCGRLMPAGALDGLCPTCLLGQGADTDAGEPGGSAHFTAPTIEEVAKLFPQLEILGLLGAGGMGAVYKARQPALDRFVALKILPTTGAPGVNFEERFNREARALARLSHPNIVAVHEFGNTSGLHYFLMEFVDGANLRQLERAGRLSPREALQIIPQICDALQYAHDEGVVHRDIKPENVLMDRKGRVKIADFGLAKILGREGESSRLTLEGQVMGTPHYMAPEQVERPLTVDHRADIYSLGVVFYEMLTGDLPLGKFSPPSRKFQLDVRLDDVVLRALENDPARRYQHASEVKSQVETIAGTPSPAASAAAASPPAERYVRWMGFPVVVERAGGRQVNRKGVLKAFGITFGVFSLAFLLVSILAGRTLFGWIGISGALSMQMRLLISALIVAYGVWRAWRRPAEAARPPILQGAVVPPSAGLSRKAALGACWASVFLIAAGLWLVPALVMAGGDMTNFSLPPMNWWQILLAIAFLPLGVTAPFGTTILGWLAVGDIRRTQGRITGLPLAVFDGLFFPLLVFNALLVWGWMTAVRAVAEATGNYGFNGPWPAIAGMGAVVVCLIATFDISLRVWRAVRRAAGVPPARPPGQARRIVVGLVVIVAVAAGIWAVVVMLNNTDGRGDRQERFQVAEVDAKTGGLLARLPKRGAVALLAISDENAPANAWWRPDGVAIPDSLFELGGLSRSTTPGLKVRDMVLRWRDLPEGASGPAIEIEPGSSSWSTGGRVLRDGRELAGGWTVRLGLPPAARTATMRVGFGLEPWQTASTYAASGDSSTHTMLPEVPKFNGRVHQISEENGQAVVTMIIDRENRDWKVRLVAVDTKGVEHDYQDAASTPLEKSSIWTYKFNLPRSRLKEFQVQVRPTYWIEFRDVALEPRDRGRVGKSARTFKPTGFGKAKEVQIAELFDFDKGIPGVFPTARDGKKSYAGIERNPSWIVNHGFDVDAGTNELRLAQMQIIDLKSDEWDTLPAAELVERMNRGLYGPSRLPSTPGARPPLTHGFRTRQGNYGLLQITGFSENWPGVQLRYKLMERAHFE